MPCIISMTMRKDLKRGGGVKDAETMTGGPNEFVNLTEVSSYREIGVDGGGE